MALPNAYLMTTKNLDAFLKSIQSAKVRKSAGALHDPVFEATGLY